MKLRSRALILPAVTAAALSAASLFLPARAAAGEACVSAFAKNTLAGGTVSFSPGDFRVDSQGDAALDALILTALPDGGAGTLTLAGQPLQAGDTVSLDAVESLCFQAAQQPSVQSASFSFTPVFSGGLEGEEVTVELHLLSQANQPPVAQNLELTTYRDTALTARFSAVDPEGDLITYQLLRKPARGAVTLPEDGSDTFVYTPYEGKTGKDTFTYVAVDAVGNTSPSATVEITIEKPATKVTYADLEGHAAANAALRLAEEDIFVGECMGGLYFFQPDLEVTRSQFVAMLMDATGLEALEDVTATGFADDTSIPGWAKPYVASALKAGVVQGSLDGDGQAVFLPDNPITRAEASVLLNRMLQITDVSAVSDSLAPAWAAQSVANLESCGVLETGGALSGTLTRAEAAELLCGALDVLEEREARDGWLFW